MSVGGLQAGLCLLAQTEKSDAAVGSAVCQDRVVELFVMAGIGGAALNAVSTF